MWDNRRKLCPRLLDYVVIVGSRHPNRNNTMAQTPELLKRYPLEDHNDFSLPPDVVFFCQPEGCISVGPKRLTLRETTSFVFTLTEKDSGISRFGICVNFFRPFDRKLHSCERMRAERHTSVASTTSSSSGEQGGLGVVPHGDTSRSPRSRRKQKTAGRIRNHTLTSLCLISHHPFFSTFRSCLFVLRKIIDACNERSCTRKVGGSKASLRDSVWGLMSGAVSESSSSLVMHEVREIETWILRLLSAPVSVPGKTRIEIPVLPKELHPHLQFALPDHTRFGLVDFPLHLPLELLGIDVCLKVLTCIMLEHKLVLQSRDYNALTMSVMAFVSMLYPLEYMFPVIPLLPTCMASAEQLLLAPTPFIIGVPASFLMYKKNFALPDDVWLVDLDSNKIIKPPCSEDLPAIPEPEGTILKNHLKQALTSMSMTPQPIKNLEVIAQNPEMWKRRESFTSSHGFNPLIYGNDVDSVDVATRVAMVRFFNSPNILGNFAEHTRTLRLYPRPVVAFQMGSFIKSRPIKTAFAAKLARTQAVEYFAEWALCPTNVVFLRVQTGVFDPLLIGDKAKWFSQGLQKIDFPVYDDQSSTLGAAVSMCLDTHASDENPTDESGSDSDGADSTSSSYSSLSDFVIDIQNSDINGETPEVYAEDQVLTVDESRVFSPPRALQVPDPPLSNSDSAMSAPDSDDGSSDDMSSPEYAPEPSMEERPKAVNRDRRPQLTRTQEVCEPLQASPTPSRKDDLLRYDSGNLTPTRREEVTVFRYDSGRVTPTRKDDGHFQYPAARPIPAKRESTTRRLEDESRDSRRVSQSPSLRSADSAYESMVDAQSYTGPRTPDSVQRQGSSASSRPRTPEPQPRHIGGRHTPEPVPRQASSSPRTPDMVSRQGSSTQDAPRSPKTPSTSSTPPRTPRTPKTTVSSVTPANRSGATPGGLTAHPTTQAPMTTHPGSNATMATHPGGHNSMTSQMHDVDKSANIMATVTDELNGLAQTASNTFSELFGGNNNTKNSSPAGSTVSSVKSSKPFAPLGNRKALVEKSGLVKHANQKKKELPRTNSTDLRSNSHSDNQQFLKDVVTSVLDGQGVGWLKLNRVKKLMEDENYRNFVVSRLNTALDKKLTDEDVHLEDVCVSKSVFKGLLTMTKALISGLEHTYQNHGVGGMASAFSVLEILHTHYWEKESTASSRSDSSKPSSLASSPFGSQESLSSLALDAKADTRSLHEEHMVAALGSPVVVNGDEYENIEMCRGLEGGQTTVPPLGDIERQRDSSGYGSESGDMLRELVKNKEMLKASQRKKTLSKLSSADSDISECSTLTTIARKKRSGSTMSIKSHLSAGYRYHEGHMINLNLPSPETNRNYLFERLAGKERSFLWDQMQFWEDAFLDAIAQERDIIGMDQGPGEMMDRYSSLGDAERRRLEQDEDSILSVMLYNMIAFMVMQRVSKNELRRKVRRLLGKCHIGLVCSQTINNLLDQINNLHGNDIDLKPIGSRQMQKQSFTVHWGADNTGDMLFMEVCDDCLILRSVTGAICDRWWYEKLVNMTYCPKTKVLCLWRRHDGKTQLNKFYTKKCKELYFCVKEAMEKAALRNNAKMPGQTLGGEFPIQDLRSGQGGLLQVCMEGIGLLFANSKEFEFFIELSRIKKCFTQKGGVFVLEEFDPETRKVTQRKYLSKMADQICYAVLCVFSYVAAGMDQRLEILETAKKMRLKKS